MRRKVMAMFQKARDLIKGFKGDSYVYGLDVLSEAGSIAKGFGSNAALVSTEFPGCDTYIGTIKHSLQKSGVNLQEEIKGPAPNAPLEDLYRIRDALNRLRPDVVLSFGGGSTIDVTKASVVLHVLGGDIEQYFGTGLVTKAVEDTGKALTPHVAIQTAASSGAHLTKYSNITNVKTRQKKLIVDESIVPTAPMFDYSVTFAAPLNLTADGALDGIAHSLEVLYGAVSKPNYDIIEEVAYESIRLIAEHLPRVLKNPKHPEGREALGIATDLGGYAIMLGGTNGGHLTSFSLVDVLSHGRACAIMNPYYTVFFAPNIEKPLRVVGGIFKKAGYLQGNLDSLKGRELGMAVAEAMIDFEKKVGFPTTLGEVEGFTDAHIERALTAAKNPQLKMKLENMPVPLTADMIDKYMGPILRSAKTGDLEIIKNV
jgi:alcohol dehydrogenase class IV